jgi:hypothetical protein
MKYQVRFIADALTAEEAKAKFMEYLRNGIPEDFDWETRLRVIDDGKRQFRSLPQFSPITPR